jgi:protein-L-isoaspartate(D-aspartate) O-methyltransferase
VAAVGVRIAPQRHHSQDWTTRDPNHLYRDVAVTIDPSRGLNNGQPSGVATWLHLLELQRGNRVLHVGCGLGYYTAVIAAAVAPGEVIGVELDAALASQAGTNLAAVDHQQSLPPTVLNMIQGRSIRSSSMQV